MTPALSTRSFTIRTAATLVPAWAIPLWIALGVALTAAFQWRFRFWWHADGVSYLEIARQYAEGHFSHAIVGNWSPLYSWLLIPIVRLRPELQLPLAHALQGTLTLLCLWAGWRLMREVEQTAGEDAESHSAGAMLVLGATLLSAIAIVTPKYLSPDTLALLLATEIANRATRELVEKRTAWQHLVSGVRHQHKSEEVQKNATQVMLSPGLCGSWPPISAGLRSATIPPTWLSTGRLESSWCWPYSRFPGLIDPGLTATAYLSSSCSSRLLDLVCFSSPMYAAGLLAHDRRRPRILVGAARPEICRCGPNL